MVMERLPTHFAESKRWVAARLLLGVGFPALVNFVMFRHVVTCVTL